MFTNSIKKEKAIKLRKSGKTYSEITKELSVAKSTLSGWLRDVGISKNQKQAFTEKKRLASLRGGLARRNKRIETVNKIVGIAEKEINDVSLRELWLIGIALYWAEGSKEKEYSPGVGVRFSNSDPRMISLFLKWLIKICNLSRDEICLELYVHDLYKKEAPRFKSFWSKKTGFPVEHFSRVYFKKGNIKTKRKNCGELYNGLLCVRVLGSSTLNRKIQGWINGIIKNQ
jgi:hypothetical protein